MLGDTYNRGSYAQAMADEPAHLVLTLDTRDPIEIGNFVSAFTSIANQFEDFLRSERPELGSDLSTEMYVREVRHGSIEADLIAWGISGTGLGMIIGHMDQILILEAFIKVWGERLKAYFKPGGRLPDATKGDLKDFVGATKAIATDPKASAQLSVAYFEDGEKKIKAAFKFDTPQARTALNEIESHKAELDKTERADKERLLMIFKRSDRDDAKIGKRSGERVMIESLSERDLPLAYASQLAEERIKHEIREAEGNIYKKGFMVDVNIETRGGRPIAYAVTNVHQVIDLEDD